MGVRSARSSMLVQGGSIMYFSTILKVIGLGSAILVFGSAVGEQLVSAWNKFLPDKPTQFLVNNEDVSHNFQPVTAHPPLQEKDDFFHRFYGGKSEEEVERMREEWKAKAQQQIEQKEQEIWAKAKYIRARTEQRRIQFWNSYSSKEALEQDRKRVRWLHDELNYHVGWGKVEWLRQGDKIIWNWIQEKSPDVLNIANMVGKHTNDKRFHQDWNRFTKLYKEAVQNRDAEKFVEVYRMIQDLDYFLFSESIPQDRQPDYFGVTISLEGK